MFNTNEYFEGKVKSVSFENNEGPASIGVMAPGEYKFGTSKKEYMTVTTGIMTVKLPGSEEWKEIQVGDYRSPDLHPVKKSNPRRKGEIDTKASNNTKQPGGWCRMRSSEQKQKATFR